jgi:hypothetical protein
MSNVRRSVLLILALVAVVLSVRSADAGECTPTGTVTLTQVGTSVDVMVVPSSSSQFVKTGATNLEYFLFNISGTCGPISVEQTVFGRTLEAQSGAFGNSQIGDFGFGITCPRCKNGRAGALPVGTQIVFHVTMCTLAQLEVANDLGNLFVAGLQCVPNGTSGVVTFTAP